MRTCLTRLLWGCNETIDRKHLEQYLLPANNAKVHRVYKGWDQDNSVCLHYFVRLHAPPILHFPFILQDAAQSPPQASALLCALATIQTSSSPLPQVASCVSLYLCKIWNLYEIFSVLREAGVGVRTRTYASVVWGVIYYTPLSPRYWPQFFWNSLNRVYDLMPEPANEKVTTDCIRRMEQSEVSEKGVDSLQRRLSCRGGVKAPRNQAVTPMWADYLLPW